MIIIKTFPFNNEKIYDCVGDDLRIFGKNNEIDYSIVLYREDFTGIATMVNKNPTVNWKEIIKTHKDDSQNLKNSDENVYSIRGVFFINENDLTASEIIKKSNLVNNFLKNLNVYDGVFEDVVEGEYIKGGSSVCCTNCDFKGDSYQLEELSVGFGDIIQNTCPQCNSTNLTIKKKL